MNEIEDCTGRECRILDRMRIGPYRNRRTKGRFTGEHCPSDQEPASDLIYED